MATGFPVPSWTNEWYRQASKRNIHQCVSYGNWREWKQILQRTIDRESRAKESDQLADWRQTSFSGNTVQTYQWKLWDGVNSSEKTTTK